ncbi:50S ribosomal protein L11 methyltransferase [Sphingobium algorifonticola]|uniref:Ribosomal protein L11 methyltransferase n=1 Tax=Sphingobium algorifonticola TaxID=2008318 RepID=A0A437J8M2_9SPHN|nr:50S ribosomal protein L11 methyltransferase [Sphingobium algorifonticola]RVT41838.1 50S ribosomal protein L11 methyltransferase [Sphingobium algorifonticola]
MSDSPRDSWKLSLPCTRAEAEALEGDIAAFALLDSPPVLMTSEASSDDGDAWQLDAYFEGRPNAALVRLVQTLVPSARGRKPVLEKLPQADWVTMSQQGLEPVTAGRFFVRNSNADAVPSGYKDFLIGAGLAFGTGQHETTAGCLAMLDRTRRLGHRFGNIADIGTGTGLLAFAALHLWPRAYGTASDIDPVSVEVTADNADKNGVPLGIAPGRLALFTAAGVDHPGIVTRGPYDLVIANILAGPLIELAPSLSGVLEEGGTLILAGLLDTQAARVLAAYRAQGLRLADRIDNGAWPTLRLRKRPAIGWHRPRRWPHGRNGEAPGYGSW